MEKHALFFLQPEFTGSAVVFLLQLADVQIKYLPVFFMNEEYELPFKQVLSISGQHGSAGQIYRKDYALRIKGKRGNR